MLFHCLLLLLMGSNNIIIPGIATLNLSFPAKIGWILTCGEVTFSGSPLTIASNGELEVTGTGTLNCPFGNSGILNVQAAALSLAGNWTDAVTIINSKRRPKLRSP
jgi:hypothetical protein